MVILNDWAHHGHQRFGGRRTLFTELITHLVAESVDRIIFRVLSTRGTRRGLEPAPWLPARSCPLDGARVEVRKEAEVSHS